MIKWKYTNSSEERGGRRIKKKKVLRHIEASMMTLLYYQKDLNETIIITQRKLSTVARVDHTCPLKAADDSVAFEWC